MPISSARSHAQDDLGTQRAVSEDPLRVTVVDTLQGLDGIESEYTALFDRCHAGFYLSFDFIRTCWEHFASASDRLLVLTIRRGHRLVGVAPFVIEREAFPWRLPRRVIRFIAEWGIGDRPGVLTTEDESLTWQAICRFLNRDFRSWDVLSLTEQPLRSPILRDTCFPRRHYPQHSVNAGVSFWASLTGSWSGFLSSRRAKVRSDFSRGSRRLAELPEPVSFVCVDHPRDIAAAFERYARLEKKTWKRNSRQSIAGNRDLERFSGALVQRLASKGRVAI